MDTSGNRYAVNAGGVWYIAYYSVFGCVYDRNVSPSTDEKSAGGTVESQIVPAAVSAYMYSSDEMISGHRRRGNG